MNKGIMHNLFSALSIHTVTSVNGTTTHVESVGTAKITALLPLSYVFYICKFSLNLLSVNLRDP